VEKFLVVPAVAIFLVVQAVTIFLVVPDIKCRKARPELVYAFCVAWLRCAVRCIEPGVPCKCPLRTVPQGATR